MEQSKQMSMFGVGPKLGVSTLAFSVLVIVMNTYSVMDFQIHFISRSAQIGAGIVLLVMGLPLYIFSGKAILQIYKQDGLSTGGVFKVCRHPMYSSWIFFNLPGIALLSGSWLFFSVPVFMYIIFRLLIKTEEKYLQQRYGEDYDEYRSNVNLAFPCVWRLISR